MCMRCCGMICVKGYVWYGRTGRQTGMPWYAICDTRRIGGEQLLVTVIRNPVYLLQDGWLAGWPDD